MSLELTDHQIALIEESFAAVAPQGERLVQRFYERLFEKHPQVRPLFEGVDAAEQRKKLLASLVLVATNLRRPERLLPALDQLGARHVTYGTEDRYYPAVGGTLLETLAEVAGDVWGPEVEDAWATAYAAISRRMILAANALAV
jgi:methyl-accepting chemotaxis protein